MLPRAQDTLQQEVLHDHGDVDAAVGPVALLRRVWQFEVAPALPADREWRGAAGAARGFAGAAGGSGVVVGRGGMGDGEAAVDEVLHGADDLAGMDRVAAVHAVVVERDPIPDRHDRQAPVAAAFCLFRVDAVVDGQEDVGGFADIGQGGAHRHHGLRAVVGGELEHHHHAGPEQDDVAGGVQSEVLFLEILFPEGDGVVGEPA